MQSFHFEVLLRDKYNWVFSDLSPDGFPHPSLPLESVVQKFLLSCFCFAPFSSNSDISWSTSRDWYSEIFVVFRGFSWTGRFVNGIWYPSTIDKVSWSCLIFSHCFTNCDSLPASGTFDISLVNNFSTTQCIRVIDASGTKFELFVKGTSFRFSKEVFTLCFWTSMLNFPSALMVKWTL